MMYGNSRYDAAEHCADRRKGKRIQAENYLCLDSIPSSNRGRHTRARSDVSEERVTVSFVRYSRYSRVHVHFFTPPDVLENRKNGA